MTLRRKRWLIGGGIAFAVIGGGLFIAASIMAKRVEPFIRDQAIAYMKQRFDGDVELSGLRVHFSPYLPLRILLKRPGTLAQVEGNDLLLRSQGRTDVPPLFKLHRFSFEVDVADLLRAAGTKTVDRVTLEGMEIQIPPKGDRPALRPVSGSTQKSESKPVDVVISQVLIHNTRLVLLPRDPKKIPLDFDIQDLHLSNAGKDEKLRYTAVLLNPKPPGKINSTGTFGPWHADEPSDTPLSGDYIFENADLGIFNGIAGILRSTGKFEGTLSEITARGEATVPDFRLKRANNRVPLTTNFEVLVDGTNGNTELKPVHVTLGTSQFTTTGFVAKHEGDKKRTIFIDADIPAGNLTDFLRLAAPGKPLMAGTIRMRAKIGIPPLDTKVKEKLQLDGNFDIKNGRFLQSRIQSKLNALSMKAKGKPDAEEVEQAVNQMSGVFRLADEVLTFKSFAFEIPGAYVSLAGSYNMGGDDLDFHGALMLDAKMSQTQTGWKHWVLKPADPFFAKNGAGTFLHIKVVGSTKDPQFGLDRGGTSPIEEAQRKSASPRGQ